MYEFSLLLDRYRGDQMWREAMAATPAWVMAECNRDKKRHRKPFTLHEWTIRGLTKPKRKKKKPTAGVLWQRLQGVMGAFGGKPDGDGNR